MTVWAVCLGCASAGWADLIVFKNGDRLTGKITSASGGKITIDTPMAGTVSADLINVQTFSSEGAITVKTEDGREVKDRVVARGDGNIGVGGRQFPVTAIKWINPPPPEGGAMWTGSVKAGAIVTRGNSESENFNFNFDATRRTEKHRFTTSEGYFFGRQRDPNTGVRSTTTDNWFALEKYDYFFTPKFYGYARTRVEQDRIAELALRVSPGIGVGYQWVDRADFKFSTEAGMDWIWEDYENDGTNEHFAARMAYHFEKRLNANVTVFHNFEYLPSVQEISDFNINADAGFRNTLWKNMFAELKAEWRYDSTPAPGAQDSDWRYLVSLGWDF
jgi:putative salt-induced outer membrane protein YdiY